MQAGGADGGLEEEYKNWAWHDARLTDTGKAQATALAPSLVGTPIDVVLVSPLSRAIQTAYLAIAPGPPFVVEELVRERNGTHPCDKRRSKTDLKADFPDLDVSTLKAEEDDSWTETREPFEQTVGRAEALIAALAKRSETSIAIATHNDWLQALLLHSSLRLADESLRRKFGNADHLPFVLTWALSDGLSALSEQAAPSGGSNGSALTA